MWDAGRSPRIVFVATLLIAACMPCAAQQTELPDTPQPQTSPPTPSKSDKSWGKTHILWLIPNYRAEEVSDVFHPLSPKEKFKLALSDSFDPSAFLVAGFVAGINMAETQTPSFGQGAEGFAKYYGASFADQAVGNFMTETVFPIALRQDPRYFVKGSGGFWKRSGYAISREVITRGDNGKNQFNGSEIAGNAVAAGISNVYYPAAERTLGKTATKWGQQLALDTFFNVVKEFWPDVRQKVLHK
jgi:hypothetical protein